jgi:hypothetical protein
MEINDPHADPNGKFFVTNGLLVVELISGRMQVGDSEYQTRPASQSNVSGDFNDSSAPTYASFQGVANTPLGDHKTSDKTGQKVTATINRSGSVGNDPSKGDYGVQYSHYEAGMGHNIASVFWAFLNQVGPVRENGQTVNKALFDPWFYGSGLPISEAYWARVRVGGQIKDVLIQAFERRVLTYTPSNDAAFQVEMGNVGRHYHDWRDANPPTPFAPPTVPPVPTPNRNPCPAPQQCFNQLTSIKVGQVFRYYDPLGGYIDFTTVAISPPDFIAVRDNGTHLNLYFDARSTDLRSWDVSDDISYMFSLDITKLPPNGEMTISSTIVNLQRR